MRTLLVGQAPSRSSGRRAFDGRSGRRIAELMDVDRLPFPATNLVERYPGPSRCGKGDGFPRAEARDGALRVARRVQRQRVDRLVLAGRLVAGAFGVADLPFLEWFVGDLIVGDRPVRELEVAVLPHPSGVSRWWNDEANLEAARAFLGALRGVPEHGKVGLQAP